MQSQGLDSNRSEVTKKRRHSRIQSADPPLDVPAVAQAPKPAAKGKGSMNQSESKDDKVFICPLPYCQKSFSYRHVRDRHVQNVHGLKDSGPKSTDSRKKPKTFSNYEFQADDIVLQSQFLGLNQSELMWNELFGVAV